MSRSRKSDIKSSINTFDGTSFFHAFLVLRLSFKESRFWMFAHSMLAKAAFLKKWIKANRTSKRHLCMHLIIDLRLVCPSLHVNHKDMYPWALLKGDLVSQHEHTVMKISVSWPLYDSCYDTAWLLLLDYM